MALQYNQREFKIEVKALKQVLHLHIEEGEEIVGASYQHVGGPDGPHRIAFVLEKASDSSQG